MSNRTKEYVFSSVITGITGFLLAVVPVIDTLTLADLQDGGILAVLLVILRAGIKGAFEFWKPYAIR